ncbi:hypothetical protein [Sulfurihydrogenibium sp.]|uniref:DNA repair protein RecO n=1 Tax=Sulfurihydrogenibium sp. TaxID=2053621 RepID=UPI00262A3FCF|nr:hypothetical protein [Sulfurihydrogenibium sp.]
MHTLFKDEVIVLKRTFVGEKDVSLLVYTKKLGRESIFIQNGQLIKNLPYVYLTEFSWFYGVFYKVKDKLYINEIDRFQNIAIQLVKDYEKFLSGYNIINWIYRFAPHPDEKIFILLKKTLYYLATSKDVKTLELAFLLRLTYLNGELNISNLDINDKEKNFLSKIFKTPLSEIAKNSK